MASDADIPAHGAPLTLFLSYSRADRVLAQWGRSDDALAALERTQRIGDSGLIYLAADPLLDPVRKSPRFANLIKAMGFDLRLPYLPIFNP